MQLIGAMGAFVMVLVVGTLIDSHRAHSARTQQVSLEKRSSQTDTKASLKRSDRRIGDRLEQEDGNSK